MHVIVATITARAGMGDRYEGLLRGVIDQARYADCFALFNIHRDGDEFLLYEIWSNPQDYAALRAAPFFQAYLVARDELVRPGFRRSDWTLLHSVGAAAYWQD